MLELCEATKLNDPTEKKMVQALFCWACLNLSDEVLSHKTSNKHTCRLLD